MSRINICFWLTTAGVVAAASPVLAQGPWLRLGDFGHVAYLDTTTILRSAPFATVRVRFAHYVAMGYDRVETQQVNCQTRQSRVLKAEEWQDDVGREAPRPDTTWRRYVRGGLGAGVLDAVCAYLHASAGA